MISDPGSNAQADSRVPPRYHAQFGEDRLLEQYFGFSRSGFYVEVGAYDGVHLSNSVYFEGIGWTGVLVEPIPWIAEECRRNRPGSIVMSCAAVSVGARHVVRFFVTPEMLDHSSLDLDSTHRSRLRWLTGSEQIQPIEVQARTLDSILEEARATAIDFVTIDVEGHEWDVLQGFDLERWRPRVLILERNYGWPDSRIMRRLHAGGYFYWRTTGVNDWFVPSLRAGVSRVTYRLHLVRWLYGPLMFSALRSAARASLQAVGLLDRARDVKRWIRAGLG